jgi:hypothetical protein
MCFCPSKTIIAKDNFKIKYIDPLTPAKAAFTLAMPGLGQLTIKKYWKIPLVYGAQAPVSIFYLDNSKKYHQFRDLTNVEEGYSDDYSYLDNSRLIQGKKFINVTEILSGLLCFLRF